MERKKVISSLVYKFIERLAVKAAGLVIGIVLARLLLPEEFGQVAIITIFINLATAIIQRGFTSALVQQDEVDDTDYSTVFYITMVLSAMMVVILWMCAPLISAYYRLPQLVWPIRVYSFSLFGGSFNSVQMAKMQREMRFRPMMYTSLAATVLSGMIGVLLAYMGAGIWALVFYSCSQIVFSCVAMLLAVKWFPRPVFSWRRAKKLFSFGWRMLVSSVLCSLYSDLRSLIIGKRYSVDELGYYDRGQQYPYTISHTIDSAIQAVMFPVMARSQSNTEQMRAMLKRSVSFGAFFITPVMVGLAAVSRSLIPLLLTEKWIPSVIYMQIICFGEIVIPFKSSSLIAIKALGRSDIYMKLEGVRRVVMLGILLIAMFCYDSVLAVAVSYVVSEFFDMFIAAAPLKKLLGYDGIKQVMDNWKTFAAAFIMGTIVYFVGFLQIPVVHMLCLQVLCGVAIYVLLCVILRVESFYYLIALLQRRSKQI